MSAPTAMTLTSVSIASVVYSRAMSRIDAVALLGVPFWRPPRRSPGLEPHLRSEEHTSELQSLMRISYAVFCLKKKQRTHQKVTNHLQVSNTQKHNIKKKRS